MARREKYKSAQDALNSMKKGEFKTVKIPQGVVSLRKGEPFKPSLLTEIPKRKAKVIIRKGLR